VGEGEGAGEGTRSGWPARATLAAAGLALAGAAAGLLHLAWSPARLALLLAAGGTAAGGLVLLGWAWHAWWRRERALEAQAEAAEQRHRRLVRHFETAGQLSHDILLLLDAGGAVVEANDRAVEAYGWPREALLGRHLGELRAPGAPGTVESVLARAREQGGLRLDTEHRRRDGTTFPVEASVRALEVDGHLAFQVSGRDISDRRRAEAAARLGELKFRTAFLEAGFGVLLVGRDGRIVEHNEAMRRMLDRPGDQLTGLPVAELVHADQREEARQQFRELMGGLRPSIGGERRYLRPDGTAVAVQLRATAIPDEAGRPAFALGIVEDVTRQRWMEAQLRVSDRMASIGALAAGVAHEINNPLSYIGSNVRFALDGVEAGDVQPAELAVALREALEGAGRVKEIVRDLRMLSRAEDSKDEACELAGVVGTVANMVRHQLRDRAALVTDVPAGLVAAGSAGRLGQVFLNLLINAAQAIEPGAPAANRVAIRARAGADGQLVVDVTDTGHGIAPEHLARIFDPFFTTKPVGLGTGLGLSICHGIVASLGGDIRAASTPGQGTTFHLQLPARQVPAPSAGTAVAGEVAAAGHLAREAACPES